MKSLFVLITLAINYLPLLANQTSTSIETILAIGPEGKGNSRASEAWEELINQPDQKTLMSIFGAMNEAGPVASNWLRSAAEVVFKNLQEDQKISNNTLGEYFLDKKNPSRARRFAFELIKRNDPEVAAEIIPGLLNDPSPELRRDAISLLMKKGKSLEEEGKRNSAILIYSQALNSAIEANQVKPLSESLKRLGAKVDLPKHFGFLMRWHSIGPFDNTNRNGFEKVYPPENEINLKSEYEGKGQAARWKQIESYDPFGKIDFNKPLGLLKESVAYAYTEFESISSRTAELRLGCKNAWKIWVNGKFIFGRDEYHRGQKIDQYKMNIQLKKGKNTILVKACQNEQTEEWTVQWEFQLRICDESGVAILASNREATPVKDQSERRSRRPKKS